MRYVDQLVNFSNDELKFHNELLKIKDNIESNENSYKEAKLLVRNINNFCKKEIEKSKINNSNFILFNTNNFSMFLLQRLLEKVTNESEFYEESVKRLTRVKKLDKTISDKIKERYTKNILASLENCFVNSTEYKFELMDKEDVDLIIMLGGILDFLNLDIINKIIGNKPMVFIGRQGTKSSVLTMLNILIINAEQSLAYLEDGSLDIITNIEMIANNLTEIAMHILLNNILSDSDINYLCKTYDISADNIQMEIGGQIANALFNHKNTDMNLVNSILDIAIQSREREYQIEKKLVEISIQG